MISILLLAIVAFVVYLIWQNAKPSGAAPSNTALARTPSKGQVGAARAPAQPQISALLPAPSQQAQSNQSFVPKVPTRFTGGDMLQPSALVGIDTKGASMKIPNYDIRSTPPIPKRPAGPWMQSTVDRDTMGLHDYTLSCEFAGQQYHALHQQQRAGAGAAGAGKYSGLLGPGGPTEAPRTVARSY